MNATVVVTLAWLAMTLAQTPGPLGAPSSASQVGPPAPEKLTDAEKIARLRRSIADAENSIKTINEQLASPESDLVRAERWFQKTETELAEKRRDLQKATDTNQSNVADLQAEVKELEDKRTRSLDRFNLAVEEQKTMKLKLELLPRRIADDKQQLETLLAPTPNKPATSPGFSLFGSRKNSDNNPQSATGSAQATGPAQATGSAQADSATSAAQATGPASELDDGKPVSQKLQKARTEAQAKESQAKDAHQRAQELSARLETLKKNIELEQRLLETALKKSEQYQRGREALDKEHQRKIAAGGSPEEILKTAETIQKITARAGENQVEIRSITERLARLQEEMTTLQSEQMAALEEAELKKREAEAAQKTVAELQNPFAPRNVLQWLLDHGGKILAIIFGMIALHLVVRIGARRIVQIILCSTQRAERECENRAQTLAGVFRNASGLLILGGGILMLMDTVGIPIIPLMGGAAVLGLAVAFGAQNLIKDYFSGFMVLMEDQYGLNDVVKIGDVVGQVERLTLRVTVLRDAEGTVHFVPHGTINTVSNMTYGWSRSVIEVGIAYKEDPERVMQVVKQLGTELRADPNFSEHILDDLDMMGVERLDDSAVTLKFAIKTRPLKQWMIRREFLRRVKHRFDQLGIEIPFPHRTVYHRVEGNDDVSLKIEQRLGRTAA